MRWGASERPRNDVMAIPSPRPLARREAGISAIKDQCCGERTWADGLKEDNARVRCALSITTEQPGGRSVL